MNDDQLLERLAEIEHQQWSHWAQALLDHEPGLSPERAAGWRRDLIPYHHLPEERKALDRVWARRVLALMRNGDHP